MTFALRNDRFAHSVAWVDEQRVDLLLESSEGSTSDAWPRSPALQQAVFESPKSPASVLAVGMAGAAHWSMSVASCADRARIVWDVACRFEGLQSAAPPRVGSEYRVHGAWTGDSQCVRWERGGVRITLHPNNTPESDGGSRVWGVGPDAIRIEPTRNAEGPATVRWKYSVGVTAVSSIAANRSTGSGFG
ncbi:MAG: hypothetical protein FJ297_19165 [Planctomycetes bacterium]|nr:hypothetical protein [Planctomycetota bacterium]